MGRHALPSGHRLAPVYVACTEYRLRFGWPVRVDDHEQEVVLLTGEALVGGSQIGHRVVVVDMPAGLGSRVRSVLWTRSLPAVVFAVQRLVYVHPYRHTRWCFLAVADSSRRYDNLDDLPVSLLDVQVIRDKAIPLPLYQAERRTGPPAEAPSNQTLPRRSWVQPPATGDVDGRLLPRLTAVLAAICDVVTKGWQ